MTESIPDSLRLLIVDDEPLIGELLSTVLADRGYSVDCADNGATALDRMRRDGADIVITDIAMPSMNGIELLREIKGLSPETEVIIMTSNATMATALEALRLGAYDYLLKPFDDLAIVPTVIGRAAGKIGLRRQNLALMNDLRLRNEELSRLYDLSYELVSELDLHEVLKVACENLAKLCKASSMSFYTWKKEGQRFVLEMGSGCGEIDFQQVEVGMHGSPIQEPVSFVGLRSISGEVRPIAIFPIFAEREFLGLFITSGDDPQSIRSQIHLLRQFLITVASALSNAKLYERIKRLAVIDGLTGLYNHRAFHDHLDRELARAKRYARPVSLILCDLDHFKSFNDRFGHPAGDRLLREVAGVLKRTLRETDFVVRATDVTQDADVEAEPYTERSMASRYGGEEFVLILPETSKAGAAIAAERIRVAVEGLMQVIDGAPSVTVSVGVAEFPSDATHKAALIDGADRALYRAKDEGRNRVYLAIPP